MGLRQHRWQAAEGKAADAVSRSWWSCEEGGSQPRQEHQQEQHGLTGLGIQGVGKHCSASGSALFRKEPGRRLYDGVTS